MILLPARKIEAALAAGTLDPWAKVKYLILPAVLGSLTGPFFIIRPLYGERRPQLDSLGLFVCSILTAYLTYWGIKRCFRTNRSIDGKAFFERFAVLLVPVMIKVMLAIIPLGLAVVFGAIALQTQAPYNLKPAFSIFSSALGPLTTFAIYVLLNNSFVRLGNIIGRGEPDGS